MSRILDENLSSEGEHQHIWKRDVGPNGEFYVIATSPPKYTYRCMCGRLTHDPKTGASCFCLEKRQPAALLVEEEKG